MKQFFEYVPKCPKHNTDLEARNLVINLRNKRNFANSFWYCESCRGYLTFNGDIEQDARKLAADFLKYELSDIVSVEML